METLESCPICDCKESKLFITTKDFLLTQEAFKIVSCQGCGFKYTNPLTSKNRVGHYKFETSVRDKTKEPFGSIAQKSNPYKWLRIASSFYKNGTFLDVGYETTAFMDLFKFAKWNALGISLKQLLETNSIENTADEQSGRGALHEIESESVEVISLWYSLERVADIDALLNELKRVLKPNGIIIIAASNPSSFDANYYKEFWEGYNVPRNVYHFSPKDMDTLFRKHEMKVFRTLPLVYDTFKNSYWSEQNKSGKASYLKAFLIGLRSNIAAIKSGKTNSGQVYLIRKF